MGINQNRFVNCIDDNFLCGICASVLDAPTLTPCGHTFCRCCIDTWLQTRSRTGSCPQCRSRVEKIDLRPVLSLRNIIGSLELACSFKEHGCAVVKKQEAMKKHELECGFATVRCPDCREDVRRSRLGKHQNDCTARKEALEYAEGRLSRLSLPTEVIGRRRQHRKHSSDLPTLTSRVTSLELQIRLLRKDLDVADAKNRRIDRELKRARDELEDKRSELRGQKLPDFDQTCATYGHNTESIARLTKVLSHYAILAKPDFVDIQRLFSAIKRCYELYVRNETESEREIHALLAVARSCNWFSDSQNTMFECWLHAIFEYWRAKVVDGGATEEFVLTQSLN